MSDTLPQTDTDRAMRLEHVTIDDMKMFVGAYKELEDKADEYGIPVVFDPQTLICMISNLQLALRHPHNTGSAAKAARVFIDSIRRRYADPGGDLDRLIKMGDDPAYDISAAKEPAR